MEGSWEGGTHTAPNWEPSQNKGLNVSFIGSPSMGLNNNLVLMVTEFLDKDQETNKHNGTQQVAPVNQLTQAFPYI